MATVLIVDDEECVHHMVSHHLHNHDIVHAYNAWQTAWALVQNQVDLVLLDLNLPGTTGFDLLDEIGRAVSVPVVLMFTGDSSERNRQEAQKRGADGFLPKTYESYVELALHVDCALAV